MQMALQQWFSVLRQAALWGLFYLLATGPLAHANHSNHLPKNPFRSPSIVLGLGITLDKHLGQYDEPLSHHKYLYAADNPVNMVDPSGRVGEPSNIIPFPGNPRSFPRGLPTWVMRLAARVGLAGAYAAWLGYAAHQAIGDDYEGIYGGVPEGVFVDRSIKRILKRSESAVGDLARRPDIVNNNTREVWEIKSGVLNYYLGQLAAIEDLWEYLQILNDPTLNTGPAYNPGSSYHPIVVSLAPYWTGYVYVDSDIDGSLVYYLDSGNLAVLSAMAGLSIYGLGTTTVATIPQRIPNIVSLPNQVPLLPAVGF